MTEDFPPYLFMRELVKLSNLLQRILKTLYTPSGLTHVTDEHLHALRNDISSWQDSLPAELRYAGIDSRPEAGELRVPILHLTSGLLRLLFVTIGFLFFRLFMRMAYAVSGHRCMTAAYDLVSSSSHLPGGDGTLATFPHSLERGDCVAEQVGA
jgi:hypothetical protein